MSSPSGAKVVETLVVEGVEIHLETGQLARQANGAVAVRSGQSLVLATVVAAAEPRPDQAFFPLTVEYRERMAAGGRIPGARSRREGRIADHEVLVSRLIDRTLRPLFPKGYQTDTQIQLTVYSADPNSDIESLGLIGAATAVHVSDVPFDGPVAGLRICRRDGGFELLCSAAGREATELELMVSASRTGLVMVEGHADAVPEEELLEALDAAESAIGPVLDAIERLRDKAGRPKRAFVPRHLPEEVVEAVRAQAATELSRALDLTDKSERKSALAEARQRTLTSLSTDPGQAPEDILSAFEAVGKQLMREATLDGQRIGGRAHDEVRPIEIEVGLLASNHGSALFTRGETQALVSTTLGVDSDALPLESLADAKQVERFILHYNFPPFAVGEVRPLRGPGRREIGHGNLARTALLPVLPDSSFPYVVRVVSDITESNGSSSMATVCGASLALMDAGVPISAPVAGIAMGLVKEGERVAILSDILGAEDHLGDMDFKVAGTSEGVTAVQLDNKLGSLPRELLARALVQARAGRLHILDEMGTALSEPRPQIAPHAPQAAKIRINPDKVRTVIGPGGRTIQAIQDETSSRISLDDDGMVRIFAEDRAGLRAAIKQIEELALELRENGLYLAEVVSVKDFGAFVRIGDHEGLVHISELAEGRVEAVEDVLALGDSVLIRVLGVDERGRLRLSRRAALGSDRSEALNA